MHRSFDEYCERLAAVLEFPSNVKLDQATNLQDDLELDSLGTFELVVVTENLAGLVVPLVDDVPPIWTLGDAYDYYLKAVKGASSDQRTAL